MSEGSAIRFFSALSVLLVLSGLAMPVAARMMSGGMGMGMGGMGMGGNMGMYTAGIADPPPGGPFREPAYLPDENPDPRITEVHLESRLATVPVNGVPATLMTYNGYYPGPVISAKSGDIVRIHMTDSFPAGLGLNLLGHNRSDTNLHTHGWHVSPEAPSDDVHIELHAGDTYDYEYNLSREPAGSLALYHPHLHGHVAESVWNGLIGTLVVEDGNDLLAGYPAHVMVLKDISLSGNQPAPYTGMMDLMMGKEGEILTVNGDVNPVLSMQPGEIQRWRILNEANARFFRVGFDGGPLNVIGTDGGLLDRPYPVPYILLGPSERIDLLVQAPASPGTYRLLALPYSNGCMMRGTPATRTLLTVESTGSPMNGTLPSAINPDAERLTVSSDGLTRRTFVLSMGMGMGFINGQNFDIDPYTVNSVVGTYEIWEIYNPSMMDHPFHQHVNEGQVLAVEGGDPVYASLYTTAPAMKDTVIVPRGGKVTLLMPVMDYSGMVMFHCHILEHEDIGMMGIWNIAPAAGAPAMQASEMKM